MTCVSAGLDPRNGTCMQIHAGSLVLMAPGSRGCSRGCMTRDRRAEERKVASEHHLFCWNVEDLENQVTPHAH